MKKRLLGRIFCSFILLLTCLVSFSQDRTVTGKVTDSTGQPLSGVSILVKGTKTGTQTGNDGNFTLKLTGGSKTLLISSIGYASKEVTANTGFLSISLNTTRLQLNDVIVIGYGTQRKKDLTGSIVSVSEKDFQKGNITTPEQMIAGKIPGVSIISNGGQPGSGSTIRIRGGSSLNASNDPLIVIDGVPLDNNNIPGAGSQLSFINPNDIASFTILKDASAAAIYGTRASNGVILITTKKGTGGALKVSFTTTNSLSAITKKVDVLNASQFKSVVTANGTAAQIAMMGTASTDWQSQVYQTALATDNNISISGGVKNFPYRISFGYLNQNGVLKTDNLQRTSVSVAINPTFFNNHLKVDINLKGSLQNTRFANQAAIGAAVTFDPTQPVFVNSKRYGGYFEWVDAVGNLVNLAGKNPVGLLNEQVSKGTPQRSIGNIQLDYKFPFLPDLHANLNVGYDVSNGSGTTFVSDSAASNYTRKGINTQYKTTVQNSVLEFYLNYVKEIKSIQSRIDVVAGYSYNDYLSKVYNYADYDAHGVKIANSDPAFPFNKPEHSLISFFGRVNYAFKDRYILTGTIRRDGSSRFSPTNRWALFSSGAFAWKISDESFLKNSKIVSNLKLRLGYGITGQQDGIGNYDYLAYYSLSAANASYQFGNTFYQGFRPGGFYANRKWEQTATSNIALDYGFLDNRISGSIDFYLKKTTDLLNNVPQPAGTNFSAYVVANVGDMENKGVEFSINLQPIRRKGVTWDIGFNLTYNKNTITNLTVVPDDPNYVGFPSGGITGGIGGQFALINAVGGSKNTFYLYKQAYNKSGNPIEGVFVDKNGDGIINQKDLYKSKSADPKFFLGFNTNLEYKKWNMGFVLRANLGNYIYNNIYGQTGTLSQIIGNSVLYNASTNYLATQFKGSNGQQLLSDYYMQNASFLRMDNLNIGYDFGKIAHSNTSLRLNAIVQNVFVITKYTGLDPEISSGIDNNFYPRPRIFALGVNLNF